MPNNGLDWVWKVGILLRMSAPTVACTFIRSNSAGVKGTGLVEDVLRNR